jgi:hypothetical protein
VITGLSQGATSDYDVLTIAYDTSTGDQRWAARYDGPVHGYDEGNALTLSPDGGTAYVIGDSVGKSLSPDYVTLAYRVS